MKRTTNGPRHIQQFTDFARQRIVLVAFATVVIARPTRRVCTFGLR